MKKLILLCFYLGVLSCNYSKENLPTDQMAKDGVINTIKIESKDKVGLLEFSKTNALKEKVFEVDYYTIDFNAEVEYKDDGYSLIYEDYDDTKGFLLVKSEKPLFNSVGKYYGEVKKGDKRKVRGKIRFTKKENGWEESGVEMYLIDKIR